MGELISPQQAEVLIAIGTLAAVVIGALWGYKTAGLRGAIVAAVCGAVVEPLWQAHKWLTRFDAKSGYFGLQSVWVLLGEVVLFIALGAGIGMMWSRITNNLTTESTEDTEKLSLNNSL
jgi:hypothetical protein